MTLLLRDRLQRRPWTALEALYVWLAVEAGIGALAWIIYEWIKPQ